MSDTPRKPLRRSADSRILLGICGGLGEFFGINPIWFRLAFIIAAIPGGFPGILIYLLLWLIMHKA
jgi:phage shock protein PspC (stress-responsive transcriptional regulator)